MPAGYAICQQPAGVYMRHQYWYSDGWQLHGAQGIMLFMLLQPDIALASRAQHQSSLSSSLSLPLSLSATLSHTHT
jgi:hypothetical protein